MSAASSRRNLRRENVRQLSQAEPDLSHRQIAERLGISKDTVRRDLDALARAAGAQPAVPDVPVAPQAIAGGATPSAPSEQVARPLPRRMVQAGGPLTLPDGFDLRRWPAVRRDLATLAQTGLTAEKIAHDAITAVAHSYRQALAVGDIEVGQSFRVSHVTLRPLPVARRTEQAG
ncbi:HTH domain-containing protein [Streptomyces phaeochromogenes]|uniref:HTH domain-containing protein n=1 Tax=Streptomyces phaeochromogenes TaxID=1923 RepID=UPI0036B9DBB9